MYSSQRDEYMPGPADTAGECAMSHPTATPARPADTTQSQVTAAPAPPEATPDTAEATPVVTQDLLVEEVSIDGMCGVY
jgi:mycofactocin precursor